VYTLKFGRVAVTALPMRAVTWAHSYRTKPSISAASMMRSGFVRRYV
jgi:hypothetical protein